MGRSDRKARRRKGSTRLVFFPSLDVDDEPLTVLTYSIPTMMSLLLT